MPPDPPSGVASSWPFTGTYASVSVWTRVRSCFTEGSSTGPVAAQPALPSPQAFYVSAELAATSPASAPASRARLRAAFKSRSIIGGRVVLSSPQFEQVLEDG